MQSDEDSYHSSSESSDEEVDLPGRAKWLKKAPTNTPGPSAPTPKAKPAVVADGEPKKEVQVTLTNVPSTLKDESWVDMKEAELDKKLAELMASRGRKNTEAKEMATKLEVLCKAAARFGARKEMPVIMHLISTLFDSHRSIDDYMSLEQWRHCYRCLVRVMELLDQDKTIVLTTVAAEDSPEYLASGPLKKKTEEEDSAVRPGVLRVVGSLESFVARLEDEYIKSLQQINPHTQVIISFAVTALVLLLNPSIRATDLRCL
jgi:translation initiation factor 3 subunit C